MGKVQAYATVNIGIDNGLLTAASVSLPDLPQSTIIMRCFSSELLNKKPPERRSFVYGVLRDVSVLSLPGGSSG